MISSKTYNKNQSHARFKTKILVVVCVHSVPDMYNGY